MSVRLYVWFIVLSLIFIVFYIIVYDIIYFLGMNNIILYVYMYLNFVFFFCSIDNNVIRKNVGR